MAKSRRKRKTKKAVKKQPPGSAFNPHEYDCSNDHHGMNWEKARHVQHVLSFPQMGPLVGCTHRKKLVFDTPGGQVAFTVVIHGAYNAMGLIGSECNGVGVLDEISKGVVLDQHCRQGTGYFGPNQPQIDEWKRVCSLTYDEFREFVNSNKRARYGI